MIAKLQYLIKLFTFIGRGKNMIFQRPASLLNHPMLGMARGMTLNQVLGMARGKVSQQQVNRLFEQLSRI